MSARPILLMALVAVAPMSARLKPSTTGLAFAPVIPDNFAILLILISKMASAAIAPRYLAWILAISIAIAAAPTGLRAIFSASTGFLTPRATSFPLLLIRAHNFAVIMNATRIIPPAR